MLAAKVAEDVWPDFKARVQAAYQAPSRAIARELAAGIVADYGREEERGVACFMDDFEACIAHLRFPVTHRRAIAPRTRSTVVRGRTPPPENHFQRFQQASGPEANLWCTHPSC
jgi:hypothetical protein